MKHYLLLCLLLLFKGSLIAQSSIVDALTRKTSGQGAVTIYQSAAIRKLIGSASNKAAKENGTKYLIAEGYRIQIFSGNNQRSSKDEAFGKQQQINAKLPNLSTYVSYTAPFWRLRAGDFLSYEEAYGMMHKLIDSFPSFKKEIFIIKEDVRIPIH